LTALCAGTAAGAAQKFTLREHILVAQFLSGAEICTSGDLL